MGRRRSVRDVARRAQREDAAARKAAGQPNPKTRTLDSFVNFAQRMGIGTDNPTSTSCYGFNPITRYRTMLEWIHRGSWLGGVAVDVVADDMTRAGVEFKGEIEPEAIEEIEESATGFELWGRINEVIKWSRLYGGALGILLIEGQDMSTPLRVETVQKDSFRGMLVVDRWMVEPSMNDLITELGPKLGLPKFYRIQNDAPALPNANVHHSRVLRLAGVKLPYWQRVQEQLWGLSILERLYDRMVAFDSATTGAAQLVYKSYLRTLSIKGLRQVVAAGGQAMEGLVSYAEVMRRYQAIEGLTLIDAEDKFEVSTHSAFSGLSDALNQFGQQLAGALQIPLVRLFGQSPGGLNASGESDLRTYYDGIKQQQELELRVPVTTMYRVMARSLGINLPDGFRVEFRSLWQLSEVEKASTANTIVQAVTAVESAGLISQQTALKELKQSGQVTGVFTNITADDINAASEDLPLPPTPQDMMEQGLDPATGQPVAPPGADGGDPTGGAPPAGPLQ